MYCKNNLIVIFKIKMVIYWVSIIGLWMLFLHLTWFYKDVDSSTDLHKTNAYTRANSPILLRLNAGATDAR